LDDFPEKVIVQAPLAQWLFGNSWGINLILKQYVVRHHLLFVPQ